MTETFIRGLHHGYVVPDTVRTVGKPQCVRHGLTANDDDHWEPYLSTLFMGGRGANCNRPAMSSTQPRKAKTSSALKFK